MYSNQGSENAQERMGHTATRDSQVSDPERQGIQLGQP